MENELNEEKKRLLYRFKLLLTEIMKNKLNEGEKRFLYRFKLLLIDGSKEYIPPEIFCILKNYDKIKTLCSSDISLKEDDYIVFKGKYLTGIQKNINTVIQRISNEAKKDIQNSNDFFARKKEYIKKIKDELSEDKINERNNKVIEFQKTENEIVSKIQKLQMERNEFFARKSKDIENIEVKLTEDKTNKRNNKVEELQKKVDLMLKEVIEKLNELNNKEREMLIELKDIRKKREKEEKKTEKLKEYLEEYVSDESLDIHFEKQKEIAEQELEAIKLFIINIRFPKKIIKELMKEERKKEQERKRARNIKTIERRRRMRKEKREKSEKNDGER